MKRAIFTELTTKPAALLSFGPSLHILGGAAGHISTGKFVELPLLKTVKQENMLRYVVEEGRDSITVIDDQSKNLREYSLKALVEGPEETLPEMRSQAWLKKKLTDIVKVKAITKNAKINGVLVGDKVGEVKYASFDKLRADGVK